MLVSISSISSCKTKKTTSGQNIEKGLHVIRQNYEENSMILVNFPRDQEIGKM
jgi:hypothetical protein